MKRPAMIVGLSLAVTTAGVGGYAVARLFPATQEAAYETMSHAASPPSGPVIYYRDPTGLPRYAAHPVKTVDGKDYLPVLASEDVSFDAPPPAAEEDDSGKPRRILYYRNPMGLADTSPVPKKDSMGMDYIPVYDGDEEEGNVVRISPGKLQRTGVRSEIVRKQAVVRQLKAPGTVQLDERRVMVVTTRSDAYVEKVADVTTGDHVSTGQPLIRLYAPEIATAGAQYVSDLNGGGRPATGTRQRLVNLGVPDETIAEIERTRKPPISITWTAPRDGVVLERAAIDGMKMSPGDVLFRLADTSVMWVLADIPEYDLGAVKPGDRAVISIRSLPGRSFEGRVALIYPQINAQTRTARIRIELNNPDNVLLPDMYADVSLMIGRTEPVVSVPDSAVIDTGRRQVVIIDRGEGRFEPRPITPGYRGDGFSEILEGVAEGDRVVVSATFLIDAESNLKAALGAMTAGETQP